MTLNFTLIGPSVGDEPQIVAVLGSPGPTGATGLTGAAGADGKTVRSGSGAPSGGLGVDGDFYINTAANTIYGPKTSGSWGSPTSIVGPTGATGSTGATGATGAAGGPLSDGDYGDVVVTGSGASIMFDSGVVTTFAKTFLDDANQAAVQTTLGLVPGTNVQAYDAELAAIAGLTSAANKLPYFTGSATASLADLSAFGRTLIDDVDAATGRGTLGAAASGAATASGLTMATARMLGRTTASSGAIEEISIGSNLTLAAGVLSAAGASGWTQLATSTTTGAGPWSFTGISQAYTELLFLFFATISGTTVAVKAAVGTSVPAYATASTIAANSITNADVFGGILFQKYTADYGIGYATGNQASASPWNAFNSIAAPALWRCTGGIQSLQISLSSGTITTNSMTIFGR